MSFTLQCQELSISQLNFAEQSFEGITKLVIWPLVSNLKTIELNCNGPEINRIKIRQAGSEKEPVIASYERISDDFISIGIPEQFHETVENLKSLEVVIHFKSIGNKCGLQFVIASTGMKGTYMYCAPYNNGVGSTFPCIEFGQACEWLIEITPPEDDMIVVCCGTQISKDDDVYIFQISRKTTARNITFVIGELEFVADEENPKFGYYCIHELLEYLTTSVMPMKEALKFLEKNFQIDFPFENYKAVFVEHLLEEHYTASSITLFNIHILHNNRIVEQMFHTPLVLAIGLCEQFFGAYIEPRAWTDSWICWGLAEHLGWLFVSDLFGKEIQEECLYEIKEKMDRLVEYERRNDGIVLDASICNVETRFDALNPRMMPQRYKSFYRLKSGLVVRSWELINSIRGVCEPFRFFFKQDKSIDKSVVDISALGRWRSLIDNLVKRKGHINITARAHYQGKRKMIELVVAQSHDKNSFFYGGLLELDVQEPDGLFQQIVRLTPEMLTRVEMATCSKWSHFKTGQKLITRKREEIDSPSLIGWVHIDPQMRLVGTVTNLMTEDEAKLMTRKESNFFAKYSGLVALDKRHSLDHFEWLRKQLPRRQNSTRIRLEAVRQLRAILLDPISEFPRDSLKTDLVSLFCEEDSANPVLKPNCWRTTGDYYVHLALIEAVSVTYCATSAEKWAELFLLYLDMLDASRQLTASSSLSASHFRAAVITAISNAFALVTRSYIDEVELKLFMDVINKQLISDFALPSHRCCVTAAALQSIAHLQQTGLLLDVPVSLYLSYDYDDNEYVRLAGIAALLTFIDNQLDQAQEPIDTVMDYLSQSEVPATIRCKVVIALSDKLETAKHSPFNKSDKSSQSSHFLNTLKSLFNNHHERLQAIVSDYDTPKCLRAALEELLFIIGDLTSPVIDHESHSLQESLDKPMIDDDEALSNCVINGGFFPPLMGSHDGNLSDDSE